MNLTTTSTEITKRESESGFSVFSAFSVVNPASPSSFPSFPSVQISAFDLPLSALSPLLSRRLLQRVGSQLTGGRVYGSEKPQDYRRSRGGLGMVLGIVRDPPEFRYESGRCWAKDAKCHFRTISPKLPMVRNSPSGVNLAQHKVNAGEKRFLPRRLLVPHPFKKVWDAVCSDAVNRIHFRKSFIPGPDVCSAAEPLHHAAQRNAPVLRLPLGPGQYNDPANYDCEPNQCQINASLSHGSDILRLLNREASRKGKTFTEANEVNKEGRIDRIMAGQNHKDRVKGKIGQTPFHDLPPIIL